MPSPAERHRNNIRAGVFVSVSLILCLVVMIVLTDAVEALRRSTETYTVIFEVSSGVANLKRGSEVRVGGVRMGEVTDVAPEVDAEQPFRRIAVKFDVDRRIRMYADAQILVSSPIIGSEAWLDVPNVGNPAAGPPPAGQIKGLSSIGLLTSLLGSENAGKAGQMVENARVFSDFLADVPDEYDRRIAPTLDDLHAVSSDVRTMVHEIHQTHWRHWAEAVDSIMTWAASATSKLDAAITEGQSLLADGRSVVAENRQAIKATTDNMQLASDRLNTQTIDKFHGLLGAGQQGLDQAVAALEDLRIDYGGWATNIGEALANANLAAQQLKLTTIETRRSPWKLLYRPSSDELEHELLYEATRSFAVAAADLRAASESVQRVLDQHGDKIAGDQEAYLRLERNLINSLANYEKAQQQMLDVLVADRQPPK